MAKKIHQKHHFSLKSMSKCCKSNYELNLNDCTGKNVQSNIKKETGS